MLKYFTEGVMLEWKSRNLRNVEPRKATLYLRKGAQKSLVYVEEESTWPWHVRLQVHGMNGRPYCQPIVTRYFIVLVEKLPRCIQITLFELFRVKV